MSRQQAVLVKAERIRASPEEVFDFLIDPEKMLQWFGTASNADPIVGGQFWLSFNGTDNAAGTYLKVQKPSVVAFTWGWDGSTEIPPGSSTVTITLIKAGDETIVELRHEGLPSASAADHGDGWQYLLERLAIVASGGDPGPATR